LDERLPRPAIIAIDGPVAAGKTSVGKLLSRELRYRFLDTGLMYRAITWLALDRDIDVEDESALGRLAGETVMGLKDGDEGVIIVDGREVSEELRRPEVDRAVSLVSKVPDVRTALVEQQREIALEGRIVVVGRDIGTVVLPYADLKLFLVASVSKRAERRYVELTRQGYDVEYDQVLKDLEARDDLDTGRAHSPLRPAPNATLVDTDDIELGQVIERVLELIGES
jgi:cytidylate kinase